ncbi:MAG: hypothetical protein AAB288_06085 [Acidobacteriota bacterium]
MKRTIFLAALITVFTVSGLSQREVGEIRKAFAETNAKLAEMADHPELSSVFAVDLTVNKHSAPYPAVGIYQRTATFYYTYGDREKDPYPNRLLKISAVYKRSARVENIDFYFDKAGKLIFAFASDPEGSIKETRLYFTAGRLIKMTDDGKEIGLKSQHAVEAGTLAKKESARLTGIFRAALIDLD